MLSMAYWGLARLAPEADGAVGIFYRLYVPYPVHRNLANCNHLVMTSGVGLA